MEKAKRNRKIILEDGRIFCGEGFGDSTPRICEVVFNTSMAGYQEILSDPSYTDQAVVMTYPLIGSYGMAAEDYETIDPSIGALIVREYNPEPSNFRSEKTLEEVMCAFGIAGVSGVDTRAIGRSIRDHGSRRALITDDNITVEEALDMLRRSAVPGDAVSRVSCSRMWVSEPGALPGTLPSVLPASLPGALSGTLSSALPASQSISHYVRAPHVVAIDCGIKRNIVRSLNRRGCRVTIVPWNTDARRILSLRPDGVLVSNGPGDPEDVPETARTVRALLGEVPVFGICLGHQILSLAYGAKTYKLKFGHRGGNHPVRNLLTGKIEITSQNHSYAVEPESLAGTPLTVTHLNLLDRTIEGVSCEADRAFGVQYHPESAPGPQDSAYLFDLFLESMKQPALPVGGGSGATEAGGGSGAIEASAAMYRK